MINSLRSHLEIIERIEAVAREKAVAEAVIKASYEVKKNSIEAYMHVNTALEPPTPNSTPKRNPNPNRDEGQKRS